MSGRPGPSCFLPWSRMGPRRFMGAGFAPSQAAAAYTGSRSAPSHRARLTWTSGRERDVGTREGFGLVWPAFRKSGKIGRGIRECAHFAVCPDLPRAKLRWRGVQATQGRRSHQGQLVASSSIEHRRRLDLRYVRQIIRQGCTGAFEVQLAIELPATNILLVRYIGGCQGAGRAEEADHRRCLEPLLLLAVEVCGPPPNIPASLGLPLPIGRAERPDVARRSRRTTDACQTQKGCEEERFHGPIRAPQALPSRPAHRAGNAPASSWFRRGYAFRAKDGGWPERGSDERHRNPEDVNDRQQKEGHDGKPKPKIQRDKVAHRAGSLLISRQCWVPNEVPHPGRIPQIRSIMVVKP